MSNPSSKEVEPALELCPPDLIAFRWAETLSTGEQSVLLAGSLRRLQDMINTRVNADSAGAMVSRTLCSELIHIAAELARGEGFLSTCAEDMNPRLRRTDILKTAEDQEHRLKDWAYRVRLVANRLSVATASPALPRDEAAHPEDFCHKCGRPNVVWFAPNNLWDKIVRGKNQPGILCPVCFIELAEAIGIREVWKVAPNEKKGQSNGPNKDNRNLS